MMLTILNKTSWSKQRGFTLLQMILVIIVLAIALSYSATLLKQQRNLDAVDNTSGDMLALMEAAQGYYQTYRYWPNNIDTLVSGAYQGLPRCGTVYLGTNANNASTCAHNNAYTISFPTGYGSGAPQGSNNLPTAPTILVSTTATNSDMARAIAAKLPNTTTQSATVQTSIAPAGTLQGADFANLMSAGRMIMLRSIYTDLLGKKQAENKNLPSKMGDQRFLDVYLPQDCPNDWTPDYEAALMQYEANKNNTIYNVAGVYICKKQYRFTPQNGGDKTGLTLKISRRTGLFASQYDAWYTGGLMILTYCRPPTLPQTIPAWLNNNKLNQLQNNNANACQFGPFTNTNGDV